jgi:hypothetical protein
LDILKSKRAHRGRQSTHARVQAKQEVLRETAIACEQFFDLPAIQEARLDGREGLHRDDATAAVERRQAEAIARRQRVHPHFLTTVLADEDLEAAFQDEIGRVDLRALRLENGIARIGADRP